MTVHSAVLKLAMCDICCDALVASNQLNHTHFYSTSLLLYNCIASTFLTSPGFKISPLQRLSSKPKSYASTSPFNTNLQLFLYHMISYRIMPYRPLCGLSEINTVRDANRRQHKRIGSIYLAAVDTYHIRTSTSLRAWDSNSSSRWIEFHRTGEMEMQSGGCVAL